MSSVNASPQDATTVIGQGSSMVGSLEVENTILVEGSFHGTLKTPARLDVGETGLVEAEQLDVGDAVVRGRVTGHLRAKRQILFTATAAFRGSVHTPHLIIEEGARLDVSEAPALSVGGEERVSTGQ